MNLQALGTFTDGMTYDVIPMENQLLMIGEGILYQYAYRENGLELLSTFSLKD